MQSLFILVILSLSTPWSWSTRARGIHTGIAAGLKHFIFYPCHCSWLGMLIRHTLAVIDYNSNIHRSQKVSKDGQGMFKKKVKVCLVIYPCINGHFTLLGGQNWHKGNCGRAKGWQGQELPREHFEPVRSVPGHWPCVNPRGVIKQKLDSILTPFVLVPHRQGCFGDKETLLW